MRAEEATEALALALAWARVEGHTEDARALDALEAWRGEQTDAELHPEPLITTADLDALDLPRGPLWGQLLTEAEDGQLDQHFATAADARSWLASRVSELLGS